MIRIRLHMYNLGPSYRLGNSFATDDAKPSHHFAQETPSPTILLAGTGIGIECGSRPGKEKARAH